MPVLSIVIPCYNESKTLRDCIESVLSVDWDGVGLQIVIVDDGSKDDSLRIANKLSEEHPLIKVIAHEKNSGKGAALKTGFQAATGDFVAVQDADLEYDPKDLRRLLEPLLRGDADVVLGSRFMTTQEHRVLHFWHSMGNKILTLLSNMFTDMNLTDMETCYKVFRREIIQGVDVEEKRFGFEPEIVAKVADLRCRVYEMGISYHGRTYDEGKKIGLKDGFRALYCIIRYNAHRASLPIQFMVYLVVGGIAALFNLACFLVLLSIGLSVTTSAIVAFIAAAVVNYYLCIKLIFRQQSKWNISTEIAVYCVVVLIGAIVDATVTAALIQSNMAPWLAKCAGTLVALAANFLGRRFFVFGANARRPW
jgi:glycosyltransferase involved in cell wall biosynthesis